MPGFTGNLALGQGRIFGISGPQETSFGVANTTAITNLFQHAGDWPPLSPGVDFIPSNEFCDGNVSDFPTRNLPIRQTLGGRVNVWACIENISMLFAKGVGRDTMTGTPIYKHLTEATDQPIFLDGTTIEEHLGGLTADTGRDYRYTGVCFDEVELTWGGKGFATIAASVYGCGKSENAATTAIVPSYQYLTKSKFRTAFQSNPTNGTTTWGGVPTLTGIDPGAFPTLDAGATDISGYITRAALRWRNGLTDDHDGGSSSTSATIGTLPFQGARSCELEIDVKIDDVTEPFLKVFAAQTYALQKEFALMVDVAGHTLSYGGHLCLPNSALLAPPSLSSGTGPVIMTLRFGARKGVTAAPVFVSCFSHADGSVGYTKE